jgi:hypothetical protein
MDKHELVKASAEIGAAWTGTWYGWGAIAVQWLQIAALIATLIFTVLRIRALLKGSKE